MDRHEVAREIIGEWADYPATDIQAAHDLARILLEYAAAIERGEIEPDRK